MSAAPFSEGDFVRLKADPQRMGIFTGVIHRASGPIAIIRAPTGNFRAPIDLIETVPGKTEDPIELLRKGIVHPASLLRQVLAHIRLTGGLADLIYSLEATNTDFHAHQFKPVLRMLESPTGRLLVADEVGLGKTIEAGLVWAELRARYDYRRLLILCPSVLQDKWRKELAEKFELPAEICTADRLHALLSSRSELDRGFVAISSLQGLRPPRGWDSEENQRGHTAAARLACMFREHADAVPLFDMVVVDEAHHLRNPSTQSNALARLLQPLAHHMLFLSATPIQLRNRDLHSLLSLVDAETFHNEDVLEDIIEANDGLVRARAAVLKGAGPEEIRRAICSSRNHPLLRHSKKVGAILETLKSESSSIAKSDRAKLAHQIERSNLLANLINRTRRRDVEELRVERRPFVHKATMTPDEWAVYEDITETVGDYALKADIPPRFLSCGPQRLLSSSIPAALEHWRNYRNGKDFDDPEVDAEGNSIDPTDEDIQPLVARLQATAMLLPHPSVLEKQDTKYSKLVGVLRTYLREEPNAKIILFSSFRSTLAYLGRRLSEDGIGCVTMHGATRDRSELISDFENRENCPVLLCSEVGSEGVDLQFSRTMINYDLPWNPMRVEQRIGRIDRLGQAADFVVVLNFVYRNTIDEAIYDRLYDRLGLCERALGGFEAILGEEISRLSSDLFLRKMSAKETEERLDCAAQAVENRLAIERDLEDEAAALIAHGEHIIQSIHTARDLHRWISGRDLANYLDLGLKSLFPGSRISSTQSEDLYEIQLSQEARTAFSLWLDRNKLTEGRRLLRGASALRCQLGGKRIHGTKGRQVEIIRQTHPLVRFIGRELAEADSTNLRPAISARIRACDLPPQTSISSGRFLTLAQLWRFSGAFAQDRIAYAGIDLSTGASLDPEMAEVLTLTASANGEAWPNAAAEVDLEQVAHACTETAVEELGIRFVEAAAHREAELSDRAEIQLATLERRVSQSQKTLSERIEKQRQKSIRDNSEGARNAAKAVQMNEGRLRALLESAEQRRAAIEEARSRFSVDEEYLAVCILEVVK